MLQSRPLLFSALGEPAVEATRDPAPPSRSRFDIESLLAKPDPPRRSAPGASIWAAAAASPGALRFGCAVRFLPVPAVCLGERPPALLPLPPRQCAPTGCRRPELEFAHCALSGSLGAPLSWRSGGPCKMKRVRTVFTPEQLDRLEKEFLKQQYMVGNERVDLAATLHLTETQVKVWFQNRRIKWRKQSLEQKAAKLSQFGGPQTVPQELPEEEDRGENEEGDVDIEV